MAGLGGLNAGGCDAVAGFVAGGAAVGNGAGQTAAGRYLFCVIIHLPDGKGYPVTARPMTAKEKRRFRKWRNR